jgi:hypothetical protein
MKNGWVGVVEDKTDLTIKVERVIELWRVYKSNVRTVFESSSPTSPIAMFEHNLTLAWEGDTLTDVVFKRTSEVNGFNLTQDFLKFGGG